ncbi:uncharacterized protein PHACADRAFT_212635 [Phanerochaete carnosa HHB-10118-sp]|uniref:DUF6534 domain-containing protein n=1 Tax=Phanerochaete carnosa (strain HHB-10118-sp) TaxID=650164 RepID=K5UQD2_PHACS|nr:uncharacterized protein PHACADRAFT_212635 [Phanerochaete carnosa HHB-10118-sp]EKM52036.1 hypothetical protein PHACADRAFT_212635 [Phanerochaete carnosa HHB-10118-sp]
MSASPSLLIGPCLGPFLIGTMASAIFFGILCLQCYIFLKKSGELRRSPLARLLVSLIWILNAVNLFSSTWTCYLLLVTNFGNIDRLLGPIPWGYISTIALTALSDCIVQGCFVWRIWTYSGNHRILTATLSFCVIVACGSLLALAGRSAAIGTFPSLASVNWLFYLAMGFDTATNLSITTVLSFYLSRKRRSPLYRWDRIITTPVIFIFQTGVLCVLDVFLIALMRRLRPNDFIFWGICIPYSTLYANALLGFLNGSVITEGDGRNNKPGFVLRRLNKPANPGTEHDIHADMRRAIDIGADSQATTELPLAVHVDKVVEREKRATAL